MDFARLIVSWLVFVMVSAAKDYYKSLGLKKGATDKEIKKVTRG